MTLQEGTAILLQAVYMIAFMYGVILIFEAAWSFKNAEIAEGMSGILAALFLALGPAAVGLLFSVFGLPGGFEL